MKRSEQYMSWGYCIITFWAQKIIQEKSIIFTKVLNYIKSSCIIFCAKMSLYSGYTYCLQRELTHFSLRVSGHIFFKQRALISITLNHKSNIINSFRKQLYHIFLEACIDQAQNQIQKDKYQQLYCKFLKSYINQGQIVLQRDNYQQLYYTFFSPITIRPKF